MQTAECNMVQFISINVFATILEEMDAYQNGKLKENENKLEMIIKI